MRATLTELHRDTAKIVRPVIHGGHTLLLTNHGEPCAKVVPIPKLDRQKAFEMLRAIGPVNLASRK